MSDQSVVNKFDFEAIAAGFMRLVYDVKMTDRFWKLVEPEFFFYGDKSPKIQSFREILKQFQHICKNQGPSLMTANFLETMVRQNSIADQGHGVDAPGLLSEIISNERITSKSNDDGVFSVFMDYLRVIKMMQWSKPFVSDYREGNIHSAINSMRNLLPEIDKIKLAEDFQLDTSDTDALFKLISDSNDTDKRVLNIGSPFLDNALGGFESQTLNVFLSVTNGGKSMMAQHLLRMCIQQGLPAHITCVEDRPKSFTRRLIASLTGIEMRKLKLGPALLTPEELTLVEEARMKINKLIQVDFVYGESVDSIQKRKIDYDAERKRKGLQPYMVDIIDYTQHVAGRSPGQKKYEQIHAAYSSRKDFALKHDKIVFDFAQINREGLHRLEDESKPLTHADLAGGFDMSAVCDVIISINRTQQQKLSHAATLFVCKGRDSASAISVHVKTDFGRARWYMEDSVGRTENVAEGNALLGRAANEVISGRDEINHAAV